MYIYRRQRTDITMSQAQADRPPRAVSDTWASYIISYHTPRSPIRAVSDRPLRAVSHIHT